MIVPADDEEARDFFEMEVDRLEAVLRSGVLDSSLLDAALLIKSRSVAISPAWVQEVEILRRRSQDAPLDRRCIEPKCVDFGLPEFVVLGLAVDTYVERDFPDDDERGELVTHMILASSQWVPIESVDRDSVIGRLGQQARARTLAAIELAEESAHSVA